MTVDRIKGRLQRLYIAKQKDDITRDRFDEYQTSIAQYTAALIGAVGAKEADLFIKEISKLPNA